MAKKKAAKKVSKEKTDPNVMEEYYEEYTFICPKRGRVTQRVKVKRLKPKDAGNTAPITNSTETVEKIEEEDGLSIYSTEELEKGE